MAVSANVGNEKKNNMQILERLETLNGKYIQKPFKFKKN